MAVRLRLQRGGAKKKPFYRIVAADQRSNRDGRFIELLGTYDPLQEPPIVRMKADRVNYWLGTGAQASETVAALIKKLHAGEVINLDKEGAEDAAKEARKESKKAALESRKVELAKASAEITAAKAAAEAKVAEEAAAAKAAEKAAAAAPAEEKTEA